MKYLLLDYQVIYEDGDGIQGTTPYRGENSDIESLVTFIKSYYVGTRPYFDEDITIDILREYPSAKEWITDVKDTDGYRYLRTINNYGGDILAEFYPEEV